MNLRIALPIGALVLLTAAARPQDAAVARPAATADATDFSDVSPDELPAVRQAVSDEATHRDRVARINRLRELALAAGDRARLAQLDDLERREEQIRDAHRIRSRAALSDGTWARTQGFFARAGVLRARSQTAKTERERLANHPDLREREAGMSTRGEPSRPAPVRRPMARGGSPR